MAVDVGVDVRPLGGLLVGPTASTTGGATGGVLPMGLIVSTTEVEEDVNGGPLGGHCWWVWLRPPPMLKMLSMAGPLGALLVGPTTSTAEVEEDVDGGPPGQRWRRVQQCPPPRLKKTSMTGPLGGVAYGPDSVHHRG
jgi:hypothetical protein